MPAQRTSASSSTSSASHACDICGKNFTRGYDLRRHIRGSHDRSLRYGCTVCPRTMAQKSNMVRHMASQHFSFDEPLVIDGRSQSTASSSSSSTIMDFNSNVQQTALPMHGLNFPLLETMNSTPVLLSNANVAIPFTPDFASCTSLPTEDYRVSVSDPLTVDPFTLFMPYLTGTTDCFPPLLDEWDISSDVASNSSGLRTPDSLSDFNVFTF